MNRTRVMWPFCRAVCVTGLVLVASVQAQLPPDTWRIADAPADLRPLVSRADLIVISLQDELLRELARGFNEGGPRFAINSCHVDVVGVTRRIARQEGVTAGRTSDRLRSPANTPRPWAAPLVAANAGRRARDVDGFVVDLGDAVGVLRPMAQRSICASCHGPADKFDPAVRSALRERYPVDRAIGFRQGDIRGWFWVEMPKKRR